MSLFYDSDEYEVASADDVYDILAELPFNLIKESIIEQINDPLQSNNDYIDVILDKCRVFKETYGDIEDVAKDLNTSISDFFTFVLTEINNRYDMGIDIDYISSTPDLVEITTSLYNFFILRYVKNISKYITNFIIDNKKSILDAFGDTSTKKDVTTLAYKKSIKNKEDLTIITNLPNIIKFILDLQIEPQEFIKLCAGKDNYDANIILDLIYESKMIGNFIGNYLSPATDEHDYIIDEIQTEVKTKFLKKMLKENKSND